MVRRGRGGRLHLHHVTPVSDGGQHDIDSLRLLCTACHARHHETDFEQRPEWLQARERAVKVRRASG
jgi:5-methylcytosine-specific restriction endonuclease McrA